MKCPKGHSAAMVCDEMVCMVCADEFFMKNPAPRPPVPAEMVWSPVAHRMVFSTKATKATK